MWIIILLLAIWILAPFINIIISFVFWVLKWIAIGVCIVIDIFKRR